MAHTDVIPTSASIASTGKGIRYVGNWAYGYSGVILIDNDPSQTMLNFMSGSGLIVASFSFGTGDSSFSAAQNIGYTLKFNNITIFEQFSASDADGTLLYDGAVFPQTIIIPPRTQVELLGFTTDPNNISCYAMLTGRVYGAE